MTVNVMPKEEQRVTICCIGIKDLNRKKSQEREGGLRCDGVVGIWWPGAKGIEGHRKEDIFGISDAEVKSRMERVNISLKMVVRKLPENEARVLLMEH